MGRITQKTTHASTKPENKLDKIAVHLEYTCFICGNIMSSAKQTLNHVRRIHGYDIPPRAVGHKRPQNNQFTYVQEKSGPWTIQEYACPSCWFHCPEDDLQALNEHTREEHEPVKVDISKDDDGYTSGASGTSDYNRARRGLSVSRGGSVETEGSHRGRRSSSARPEEKDNNNHLSEITGKLDELSGLFKSLFHSYTPPHH